VREGGALVVTDYKRGIVAALAFRSGLAAHEQRETFHGFPP
jgi:hypothetical protein